MDEQDRQQQIDEKNRPRWNPDNVRAVERVLKQRREVDVLEDVLVELRAIRKAVDHLDGFFRTVELVASVHLSKRLSHDTRVESGGKHKKRAKRGKYKCGNCGKTGHTRKSCKE